MPDRVSAALDSAWKQAVAANALVHMEVSEIAERLDSEQIPWILLKGPSVADSLYSDPGARPMADIDVLINPSDLSRSISLLAADRWKLRSDMHPKYVRITHAVLVREEPYVSILEIHHNLLGTVPLPEEHLIWDGVEMTTIGDKTVRVLGAADRAIHLCVHAVLHHGLRSASQLLDISLACARLDSAGWGTFVDHARRLGVVEEVYTALVGSRLRQDVAVPEPVLEALSRSRPGLLRRKATSLALVDSGGHAGMTISRLIMTHGWGNRLRYAQFVLFPPRDWLAQIEGRPSAISYVRRLISGLATAARQIFARDHRDLEKPAKRTEK